MQILTKVDRLVYNAYMSMFSSFDIKEHPPRERILLTAHKLFYGDGIRATGIDRVISESGVAKVTFYRYFPSKNELIQAYLTYRHERWMDWFTAALNRHSEQHPGIGALVPALREWFDDEGYRGCAFINSVVELGVSQPEVVVIARMHKERMTDAIAALLPASKADSAASHAVALAIDGAIVQAQYLQSSEAALISVEHLLCNIQRSQFSSVTQS
jgi:AcrR family transcriptional regulator